MKVRVLLMGIVRFMLRLILKERGRGLEVSVIVEMGFYGKQRAMTSVYSREMCCQRNLFLSKHLYSYIVIISNAFSISAFQH